MSNLDPNVNLVEEELKKLSRAFLVGVFPAGGDRKLCEENVKELVRLCDTFGFEVVGEVIAPLRKMDPRTFLGKGKVEELLEEAEKADAQVVIFDDEIFPGQQRNLEKLFKRPVIDRTELIIEVFAQRAHTREARLQVELAKCRYQLPRLKRMWTHLERQAAVGGTSGAYLKGMGEKQLEVDKRLVQKRIDQLQQGIVQVRKQRETQRRQRLRSHVPTFAIVGYTNAGKSTLLKTLTNADVFIEDKLFATLDTTTRKFTLPSLQEVLLIDTVGFIRKIPHTLVAAFKSTLEEALFTDVLLHLVDISHPMAEQQAEETRKVLEELGAEGKPMITVLNKIDACPDPTLVHRFRLKYPRCVAISALERTGLDQLIEMIGDVLQELRTHMALRIPQSHYALVSELSRFGKVISQDYEGNDILLEIELPKELEHKALPFVVRG